MCSLNLSNPYFEGSPYFGSINKRCAELINNASKIVSFGYAFPTNSSKIDRQVLEDIYINVSKNNNTEYELVCKGADYKEIEKNIQNLAGDKIKGYLAEKRKLEE